MYQNKKFTPPPAPSSSFMSKASLFGAGMVVGIVAYPFVKKTLEKVAPTIDELFNNFVGKAEGLFEESSDFLAKAKMQLKKERQSSVQDKHKSKVPPLKTHNHNHNHPHDHDDDHLSEDEL